MFNILENPFFYNLRFLVAGNQQLTKDFIRSNYDRYSCHSVLDVGSGTGDFSRLFNKNEYQGIDVNNKYIDFAQNKYPFYKFIALNILEYNYNISAFDAVLIISVLHHLSNNEAELILSKVCEITKKIIIIVDLNPDASLLKRLLIRLDCGKFIRTTEQKKKLLAKFGKVAKISNFSTGLASQTGIILIPKSKT